MGVKVFRWGPPSGVPLPESYFEADVFIGTPVTSERRYGRLVLPCGTVNRWKNAFVIPDDSDKTITPQKFVQSVRDKCINWKAEIAIVGFDGSMTAHAFEKIFLNDGGSGSVAEFDVERAKAFVAYVWKEAFDDDFGNLVIKLKRLLGGTHVSAVNKAYTDHESSIEEFKTWFLEYATGKRGWDLFGGKDKIRHLIAFDNDLKMNDAADFEVERPRKRRKNTTGIDWDGF